MRTYRALICEDQQKELAFIYRQLKSMFQQHQVDFSFTCFDKSTDCMNYIKNSTEKCDVFFVDIEMPGYSGLELCRQFRDGNQDSLIVFISNREEMVFQTFEVKPFRFLRKNHFIEEAERMVEAVIAELKEMDGIMITIKELHAERLYTWNINQILYIESLGKTCRVMTETGAVELQYRLMDFEEKLSEYGFLKPHRSYIVNYRKISMIRKNEVLLDDGTCIPLSRYQAEETKKQYIQLVNGG